MQELTYEQYKEYGGTSDHSTFLLLRIDCEAELERQTFGRIDKLDENIIRCMVLIMDTVLKDDDKRNVASYSNDFESVSFNNGNTEEGRASKIRDLCLKYLPSDLTYRGVK